MGAVFTCSIDDGHPSDLRAAELLAAHGLRATFYVPIGNCEGPPVMSASQIRQLGDAFEIGSHTLDHRFLRSLDAAEARRQVIEGKVRLEDMLGRSVQGFCYPGGKYRAGHVALVKKAGFRYARTTANLRFDCGKQAFEMPTTIQFYPHRHSVYLRNFIRGGDWARRHAALSIALAHRNWIERLYALFDHASRTGGVFHLWAHAKDIDELDGWSHFDHFLAHVAAHVAPEKRLDNGQLAAHTALIARGDAPVRDQCDARASSVK